MACSSAEKIEHPSARQSEEPCCNSQEVTAAAAKGQCRNWEQGYSIDAAILFPTMNVHKVGNG